jgi:hypothetical protein
VSFSINYRRRGEMTVRLSARFFGDDEAALFINKSGRRKDDDDDDSRLRVM